MQWELLLVEHLGFLRGAFEKGIGKLLAVLGMKKLGDKLLNKGQGRIDDIHKNRKIKVDTHNADGSKKSVQDRYNEAKNKVTMRDGIKSKDINGNKIGIDERYTAARAAANESKGIKAKVLDLKAKAPKITPASVKSAAGGIGRGAVKGIKGGLIGLATGAMFGIAGSRKGWI
jgi:hypothetical protein